MMDRSKIPTLGIGKRNPDWAELYQKASEESVPWFYSKIDPDILEELLRVKDREKRLLDVGTGFGLQAKLIADMGFKVTAIDISEAAIKSASLKYNGVTFRVANVTTDTLGETYDLIVDRGCFHVLEKKERSQYINFLNLHLKPEGLVVLKVFNQEQVDADFGPYRFTMEELHRLFSSHFMIKKIKKADFQGTMEKYPTAWCLVMKKTAGENNDA